MSSRPRRTSIDNWQNDMLQHISSAKNNLSVLWDEMALSEPQREERLQDSKKLVFDLLENMVNYERQQLEEVKRKCVQYRKELDEFRQELSLEPIDDSTIPKGLAPSGNWLKAELRALKMKKKERITEQLAVFNEAKEACERVGWKLTCEDISNTLVPPSRINEWKKQKSEALAEYYEKIQFEYDELMIELQSLWDLCLVPETERYFPKTFNPEYQTCDDFENVKNEIAQLKLRYSEGEPIYMKLREWINAWEEKLQTEDISNNSKDKYHDRGGSLQARLKRETQLKQLVPKKLKELEDLCKRSAKVPKIGATMMSADEYARFIMQSYEDAKIIEKLNKEEQRKAQLAQESRFGVSPSPNKTILHRTKITPASIRKTPRKPLLAMNLSKLSQPSSIEPTSGFIDGPKTSSPKNQGLYSPRRIMFSPALSVIPSSPNLQRETQLTTPTKQPKSPSRHWRY